MDNYIWILFLTMSIQFSNGVTFPNGHETPRKPGPSARISAPRPAINIAAAPGTQVIGRQPPPFPPPPMPPPQPPIPGGPFPNWQAPFPGVGPFGQAQPPGAGWPQLAPEWNSAPPPQPSFWPQPSQWPYVDTAAGPLPNNGAFRWGQNPQSPPPPPMASPNGAPPPWQNPIPAIYSQYLPTTLGAAAVPPSPPWSAPGTIIGGPQLSPQGPWSAQPIGHSPAVSAVAKNQNQAAMPPYIRTGYDSAALISQSIKNANPFARSTQNLVQTQRISPEFRSPMLEPAYSVEDMEKWANWQRPDAPTVQIPAQQSNEFELASPYAGIVEYPYQPAAPDPNANQMLTLRGRDAQDHVKVSDIGDFEQESQIQTKLLPEDSIFTTQSPTPRPTDDPYALNPNIIFGGPASLTFPEIPLGLTNGFVDNKNSSPSLSASSIRIGDILSFPHGTQFGVIPPPAAPMNNMKKLNLLNIRAPQTSDIFELRAPEQPKPDNAVRILQVGPHAESGQDSNVNQINTQQVAAPVADTPANIASERFVGRTYKGVKHSQNVAKNSARSLMDDVLRQIQELKVVLYGRVNCTVCQETEALLKNYSIPVYYFELDTDDKGDQMLTLVQQMTHSLEMPLTFICGRFVGGHQRLHDLHINQQITPLLRECLPAKRRSSMSISKSHTD